MDIRLVGRVPSVLQIDRCKVWPQGLDLSIAIAAVGILEPVNDVIVIDEAALDRIVQKLADAGFVVKNVPDKERHV